MGLFSRLLRAVFGPLSEPDEWTAPRTLCCGAVMHDMWMHAADCPNLRAVTEKLREHGRDWKPACGSIDADCPHCGFPGGQFFGIYTVGQECPWCGYVEKNCSDGPGAVQRSAPERSGSVRRIVPKRRRR